MMNQGEYLHLIQHDLAPAIVGTDRIVDIALEIFNFFTRHDPQHHKHLTFRSFRDLLSSQPEHPYLLSALAYLCNGIPLLSMEFELYDEDNEEFFEVSITDIQDAEKYGSLTHPSTGLPILDYKKKVFVYYEPRQLAQELYANARRRT